jgi:hypothetical protein
LSTDTTSAVTLDVCWLVSALDFAWLFSEPTAELLEDAGLLGSVLMVSVCWAIASPDAKTSPSRMAVVFISLSCCLSWVLGRPVGRPG